jgi:hypothetical protein
MTAPTIQSRQYCPTLHHVARSLGMQGRQLSKLFRESDSGKKGRFLTLQFEKVGLLYIVDEVDSAYLLTVGYTQDATVFYIALVFDYLKDSPQALLITRIVGEFAAALKALFGELGKTPVYLEWGERRNGEGLRVFVIGAPAALVQARLASLRQKFKAAGLRVSIRVTDGDGDALNLA